MLKQNDKYCLLAHFPLHVSTLKHPISKKRSDPAQGQTSVCQQTDPAQGQTSVCPQSEARKSQTSFHPQSEARKPTVLLKGSL